MLNIGNRHASDNSNAVEPAHVFFPLFLKGKDQQLLCGKLFRHTALVMWAITQGRTDLPLFTYSCHSTHSRLPGLKAK